MRTIGRLLARIGEAISLLQAAGAAAEAARSGRRPSPEVLRRLGIEPAQSAALGRG